jgi:hypothetical protein
MAGQQADLVRLSHPLGIAALSSFFSTTPWVGCYTLSRIGTQNDNAQPLIPNSDLNRAFSLNPRNQGSFAMASRCWGLAAT